MTPPPDGISIAGLFGGALAIVVVVVTAAAFATSDDEQAFAFIYGPLAAAFLPAVWASIAPTPHRNAVLRGSTVLALVVAFGSVPIDYGLAGLLAPATVLLAQAAGLIFQGGKRT